MFAAVRGKARQSAWAMVVSLAAVAPGFADTLADAMSGAYLNSGLLEQNRALLRAADEDVASAVAALRPILRYSGSLARGFGEQQTAGVTSSLDRSSASVSLIADLLLYDAGAGRAAREAAKETVLATRQSLIGLEQQVLLRAVSAFMTVRSARQFVALRENNLRLLTQELRAAQDRFDVGEVTRTDVALAQARLAGAQSGLATAQGNLQSALAEYENVVGKAPGTLVSPKRLPELPSKLKAAEALAMQLHPDLKAAQHQVKAAELNIARAEAAVSPRVTATGRLTASDTLSSNNYSRDGSIGIEVGGVIYQGGALASGVRRAMAGRDAQRGNLHAVQRNVTQNVGAAFAQLAAVRANLMASEEQIKAARIAFRGVREEATLGARTTLDVLDAEQELLDAEAARISAQADLYVAAYSMMRATGQLTAQSVGLPVPLYDAQAYFDLVKDAPAPRSKQGAKLDQVLKALQKD
jgi:outer membrane protein